MLMQRSYLTASALALSLALAGCGGGSSSSTPAPSTPTTPTPSTPTPPTATHTVSAAISGLATGASITLRNNTSDTLTESADGTYPFSQAIAEGATYNVVVQAQPTGQTCTVANGSGTMGTSDVTATISCTNAPATATHTVGGSLTGLPTNTVLKVDLNNSGVTTTTSLNGDGVFTLSGAVAEGASYAVTIATANQPSGQTCSVTNGSGTMGTADVINVAINCIATQTAAYSQVYSFGDSSTTYDGASPSYSGLVADGSGNLYGVTSYGGISGAGTIYKLTPDSTATSGYKESVLFDFNNTTYKNPRGSLVYDSTNNTLYGTVSAGGPNGGGAVFQIKPDGSLFNVIHDFAGSTSNPAADGYSPRGALALDSNGYLYGTTFDGGSSDDLGTVYRINTTDPTSSTSYKILHAFQGIVSQDGSTPEGGVYLDPATNTLYGTTLYGGADNTNSGTVFSLPTTWDTTTVDTPKITILHSFTAINGDGGYPIGTVVLYNGALYGTTNQGGTYTYGAVFEQDLSGTGGIDGKGYTTLYSFNSSDSDGYKPTTGLLLHNGLLYGTASTDPTNVAGTVFKIAPNGTGFFVIHAFAGGLTDGQTPQSPLMFDPTSGMIFGETYAGGAHGIGSVFRVAP
ncbi:MAG: hypothetical protein B7X37_02270 [Halothiobacillus sp. 14-55-98]|jgi:uncharacterized repeat protein (TIGR03803 family)|nr:MAG: hypothetical protein B7X37_02270 [Halothiobacillus sp. 14-55-98]